MLLAHYELTGCDWWSWFWLFLTVKAITCETTAAQLCQYQKPAKHCPRYRWQNLSIPLFHKFQHACALLSRLYCQRNCLEENPHLSRVIGTRIYSDVSPFIGYLLLFVNIKQSYLPFIFCNSVEVKYMQSCHPRWGDSEWCWRLHWRDASGHEEILRCLISKWRFLREVGDSCLLMKWYPSGVY